MINLTYLLKSRKFWISVVTILILIAVSWGVEIDDAIVDQIVDIVMVLIAAIAVEDSARHLRG